MSKTDRKAAAHRNAMRAAGPLASEYGRGRMGQESIVALTEKLSAVMHALDATFVDLGERNVQAEVEECIIQATERYRGERYEATPSLAVRMAERKW